MDREWMRRAITLAELGTGFVNPNPKVGAVIVKDDVMIGEGYHQRFGEAHAEINAINSVEGSCEGATIYVTLEPCHHYGKTPPCVDAIIREKFKRVVIGMMDPNPKVAGKSIEKLKAHGIEVTVGVMEEECKLLNPGFIKLMHQEIPYVLMKTAMTLDGKIATAAGESKWISGEEARIYVHKLRHQLHGIMVGINTVLMDDPMLNVRIEGEISHPIRIIVDSKGRLPESSSIVQSAKEYRTIVITTYQMPVIKRKKLMAHGVEVEVVADDDGSVDISAMMKRLGKLSIDSILLEGGGILNDSMLRKGYVDEIVWFIAPKIFGGQTAPTPVSGEGIKQIQDAIQLENMTVEFFGQDICIKGKVKNNVHRTD